MAKQPKGAGAKAGSGNDMGIASVIAGIVALIIALIPMCDMIAFSPAFAFAPAFVGLILGVINVMMRGEENLPKGVGNAGIMLNIAAMAVMVILLLAPPEMQWEYACLAGGLLARP